MAAAVDANGDVRGAVQRALTLADLYMDRVQMGDRVTFLRRGGSGTPLQWSSREVFKLPQVIPPVKSWWPWRPAREVEVGPCETAAGELAPGF